MCSPELPRPLRSAPPPSQQLSGPPAPGAPSLLLLSTLRAGKQLSTVLFLLRSPHLGCGTGLPTCLLPLQPTGCSRQHPPFPTQRRAVVCSQPHELVGWRPDSCPGHGISVFLVSLLGEFAGVWLGRQTVFSIPEVVPSPGQEYLEPPRHCHCSMGLPSIWGRLSTPPPALCCHSRVCCNVRILGSGPRLPA